MLVTLIQKRSCTKTGYIFSAYTCTMCCALIIFVLVILIVLYFTMDIRVQFHGAYLRHRNGRYPVENLKRRQVVLVAFHESAP